MAVQTYTYTYTRTDVLLDQVDRFLRLGGVSDSQRKPVVDAVNARWIEALAVFVEKDGRRVLEGALDISWNAHSDHAEISISTDLPGWDGGLAPELSVMATRLAEYARSQKLATNFWIMFIESIRDDPVLYKARCEQVGVGGSAPDWKSEPRCQRIPLQDLAEAHATLRDAT